MTDKSCLNCAFGMTEKIDEDGACYCNCSSMLDKGHEEEQGYWYTIGSNPCSHHKPRQNKCETDGCKWMVEGKCTHEYNLFHRYGKVCIIFKKQEETQEETMETIKVNGKAYECIEGNTLALNYLFNDAKHCSDATRAVWKFSKDFQFFDYHDKITLTPRIITYINQHPSIIPWLLEKGYIREVVEETYEPGQWFKEINGKRLQLHAFCVDKKIYASLLCIDFNLGGGNSSLNNAHPVKSCSFITASEFKVISGGALLIKIDPPLITEQSDTAERKPELCMYVNKWGNCQNQKAKERHLAIAKPGDICWCSSHGYNRYTDCPEYTPK